MAIEFAMLAPAYFLLIIGIMECSLMMFAQHVLESASANASRIGKTGYVGTNETRQQTIMDTITHLAGFIMDPSKIVVTSTTYQSFGSIGAGESFIDANGNGQWETGENYTDSNGNGQYDTDVGTSGMGNAGDIVVYTISYPWPVMTPVMSDIVGTNGVLNLASRVVVKNEPYDQ
ncbi:MAG: TadE/TadG family type IV pilus assembly protein [Alphaproteobacteria bacterium]